MGSGSLSRRPRARRAAPAAAAPAARPALDAALPVLAETPRPPCEVAGLDRGAHLAHEVHVVVQVVHAREQAVEHLAAAVEVMQVGAREGRAGAAGAALVERAL